MDRSCCQTASVCVSGYRMLYMAKQTAYPRTTLQFLTIYLLNIDNIIYLSQREEGVHGHFSKEEKRAPSQTYLTVPWTKPGLCQISQ